ncbi:NUDIX hydrolase [Silvanigrella aquatica]|uniref:Nudix hydrolase domain-containing protein n=1 Tax=Silvanigrella aquatica TaxID=1915309 RepID=A0A1L4CX93_9BACT|nr:NUDIX domain-containing protein [Silvanigrella aquatica]APJ02567.1 hypothetical protein AXG55_00910 [Silvanigrella aquatica]
MINFNDDDKRVYLLKTLSLYKEKILDGLFNDSLFMHEQQLSTYYEMTSFIQENSNCFFRECVPGHITGSAYIINASFTKMLFTYHAKLKKWLQLGGHCDGEYLVHNTALREAHEESGLKQLNLINILNFPEIYHVNELTENKLSALPIDIDIHIIPERKNDPKHKHYDVSYLILANESENIIISEESLDLKWIDFKDIKLYTNETKTLRQINKIQALIQK